MPPTVMTQNESGPDRRFEAQRLESARRPGATPLGK